MLAAVTIKMITDSRDLPTEDAWDLHLRSLGAKWFVGRSGTVVAVHEKACELQFDNYLIGGGQLIKVYAPPDRLSEPDPVVMEIADFLTDYLRAAFVNHTAREAEVAMANSLFPEVMRLTTDLTQGQIWDLYDTVTVGRERGTSSTIASLFHQGRIRIAWVDRDRTEASTEIKAQLAAHMVPYRIIVKQQDLAWDKLYAEQQKIADGLNQRMDALTPDQLQIAYRILPMSAFQYSLYHRYFVEKSKRG